MTDDVYSPLLIFALVNLGIAVALLLLAAWRNRGRRMVSADLPRQVPYLLWLSRLSSLLAQVTAMLALTAHFIIGHSSGTDNYLPVRDFAILHPAPFVIIVLSLLAFRLARQPNAA